MEWLKITLDLLVVGFIIFIGLFQIYDFHVLYVTQLGLVLACFYTIKRIFEAEWKKIYTETEMKRFVDLFLQKVRKNVDK